MADSDNWISAPYREAIDYLRSLVPAAERPALDAIETWAEDRAFTIAGVTKLEVLQRVLDELTLELEHGGSVATFAERLEEIFAAEGLDPLDTWRAENIFRTNVQTAYGAGRWAAGTDPEIADEIWGWEYHAVHDDRTRPAHAALDGKRFKGQEGAAFFPPWEFQCRCSARWILKAEAERLGLEKSDALPSEAVEALAENTFTSPAVSDDFEPDLSNYAPGLITDFLNEKGGAGQ